MLLQDFVAKFDTCDELYIEFNNTSADLEELLKSHEGDSKEVEQKTSQVNNEFNRRQNKLISRKKVAKNVDRVVTQFTTVVKETEDWCDHAMTDLDKKGPVTKDVPEAKKEIQEIDVCDCFILSHYLCICYQFVKSLI